MVYGHLALAAGNYVAKRTAEGLHKRYFRESESRKLGEADTSTRPNNSGYGGSHTRSTFRAKKHSKKHDKKLEHFRKKIENAFLEHRKFGFLDTFRVSSVGSASTNQQCWTEIPILMGNGYDLSTIGTLSDTDNTQYWTTKYDAGDWPTLVDCFENAVTTLTGVPATTPGLGPTSTINTEAAGYIYGYNINVLMQNLNAYPMRVKVYECVAINSFTTPQPSGTGNIDNTAGIMRTVTALLTNTNAPNWLQSSGFTTNGPVATYQSLGFTPMTLPYFGTHFKVLKCTEHILDGSAGGANTVGQMMNFEIPVKHKHKIRLSDLRGNVWIKGLSRCLLISEEPAGLNAGAATPLNTMIPAFGTAVGTTTLSKIHGMTYRYTKRFMMAPEPFSTLMARPRQQENA